MHGLSATTGLLSVTTTTNCIWTIMNTNDWITIMSASSGTGTGTVTYSISSNLGMASRTGLVMVADQVFTLTQRAATNGFGFDSITLEDGGQVKLRLVGGPTGVWELQGSSDLTFWEKVFNFTNVAGVVECIDMISTNANRRFYRAVLP
jgi:hypothetical protein